MQFASFLAALIAARAAYALPAGKTTERSVFSDAQDSIVIKILTGYGDKGSFINGELQSLHPISKDDHGSHHESSSSSKTYTSEQVGALINVLLSGGAKE